METCPDLPFGSSESGSYPDYLDFLDKARSFQGLGAFTMAQVALTEAADALPQLRMAMAVSGNFFRVLGVEPELGRGFSAAEDRVPGRDAVLVLGHDAWRQRFAGDPKVLGRTIRLNDIEFRIVGVAPEKFTGMDPFLRPDLYLPRRCCRASSVPGSIFSNVATIGASPSKAESNLVSAWRRAQAELTGIARALERTWPETNRNHTWRVRTELQVRVAQSPQQAALTAMLLGIAGRVLIIACANVANLLLSRARARAREMAVRLAIGAGRGRLLRQLLTESLMLALIGGALGLPLADSGADYFSSLRFPTDLAISFSVRLDERVDFSLVASVASALLFGLVPAIRSVKTDLIAALKTGDSESSHRRLVAEARW